MEVDLSEHPAPRDHRLWIEVTLITGFIFSLLIGIGALAALIVSARGAETVPTASALQTIDPKQIVPQLALAQLAGDSAEALAYQAAAAGELDTAKVIALTTTEFKGPQRLALALHISRRYLDSGRSADDVPLLKLALAVAVLDPSFSGVERSTALVQIANGFLKSGEEAAALDASIQAMRVAEQTPDLLPAHRSDVYESLQPLANELGDPEFSQRLSELTRNPYAEPRGFLIQARLSDLASNVVYDPAVSSAVANREQAARVLADRIILTGGLDIGPETQGLAAALVAEEQVRDAFYRRSLTAGMSLEDQYALLLDKRDWTALRIRVALQGFGLPLVPEWERDLQLLRQELSAATVNAGLVVEAMADTLPDPVDQAMLHTEAQLWLAKQAEIGLLPGASLDDLNAKLQALQSELTRLGNPVALPITYEADASPPGFRIQSSR